MQTLWKARQSPRGREPIERRGRMRTEQTSERFTDDEVAGFVQKLEAWNETLSETEQRLLAAVVLSALEADGGGDVRGYFIGGYLSQLSQQLQPKLPRRRFEDKTKDLESQDKLGNFEIQNLMNQS
jgi:hypothetical protein